MPSNDAMMRRFLRERGLAKTFRRFRRYRKTPKRFIEVAQTLEDGSVERRRLVLQKEMGRTVVRDFLTLDRLASSEKTIPKTVEKLRKRVKFSRDVKIDYVKLKTDKITGKITRERVRREYDVKIDMQMSKLKLKIERKKQSYNPQTQVLRTKVITNRPKRTKVGSIVVDATIIKGDQQRRVQSRSRHGFNLSGSEDRERALQDAIDNAPAVADIGTPDAVVVHHFWFEYFFDKREELISVRW